MGNVFRSKEVYARVNHNLHNRDEIIPVRGVYVSGEYRPPFYNEPCINITAIAPIKAKIVDFTSAYADTATSLCCGFAEMDCLLGGMSYQVYGKAYSDAATSLCCGFVDMDCTLDDTLDYYIYGKTYSDTATSLCCGFVEMDTDDENRAYTLYTSARNNSTPEPILQLTDFTSDEAIISNYIP